MDTSDTQVVYTFDTLKELSGDNIEEVTVENIDIFKSTYNDVQIAIDAFIRDYPEIFWIDYSKVTYSINYTTRTYSDGVVKYFISSIKIILTKCEDIAETATEAYTLVQDKANEIVNSAADLTNYEKLKYYHDYLCKNIEYDMDATNFRNIYGGLIGGAGVCEAYAESFKYLCDLSGIPSVLVMGKAGLGETTEDHLWNYCMMEDGKWYAVDTTWDDQPNLRQQLIYDHFLCGADNVGKYTKKSFSETHRPIGDFSYTGIHTFTYPDLSVSEYIYVPQATSTPSAEPTETPTPEPTETPSSAPTVTPSPEPTATPSPESTATPSPEPTPTATPSPEPTETPSPEPTVISSPTPQYTATATPVVTVTPVNTSGSELVYLLGDVDLDTKVTSKDALEILKIGAKLKLPTELEFLAGDVNNNLLINTEDALRVLQYVAKLIDSLE